MLEKLSSYLLDSSLVDYTVGVVVESLRDRDNFVKKQRATLALAFFEGILDPAIEAERPQIEIFSRYNAAFQDADIADAILKAHPDAPSADQTQSRNHDLTATHRVLTLPDTLDVIFSHISTLTKSTRETLRAAALTSVSMHYAAQLRLWKYPRDLDTVEQQVRFAFGVSLTSAFGEGLGVHVERLRIRVSKGAWNTRLVTKIVELCPSVADLTLHWGDSDDGSETVTNVHVSWLTEILAHLPNLSHLTLAQFSFPIATNLTIPSNAILPFTRLNTLRMFGFGFCWYFDAIGRGIGSNLTTFKIGRNALFMITPAQITFIASKLTSLTTLHFDGPLELYQLRLFVETSPGLENVEITTSAMDDRDDIYMANIYAIIADLPTVKEVWLTAPARPTQIIQLAKSSSRLEAFTFAVVDGEEESAVKAALIELITAKRATLRRISDCDGFKLSADDQFVEVLARAAELEWMDLTFDPERVAVSDTAIEKLLTSCSRLRLSDGLTALAAGKPLYEENYKAAFERAEEERDKELEEDVLAN
ncbi:hypothetical protein D9619_001288 [Psilocybe cf. subviscida]|uniref:Uncharacterized protein n=1 Tax=Psilocybe cf. subviscida TaxID=2480587 RepID=A0A8H5F3L7_9AGAR|nr:hypothetical protein D9619_001288 [Psilocybe cf. subviscida]